MDTLTKKCITIFSKHQYYTLNKNYQTKKDTWVSCDLAFLVEKLKEEITEFFEAPDNKSRMRELIDISNICFFYM
jgi:hypothetical protein